MLVSACCIVSFLLLKVHFVAQAAVAAPYFIGALEVGSSCILRGKPQNQD
jgi:hypothetical protein